MNALRTQPGDVVCMADDDHQWSATERACGQYRFIDLPGVPQEQLAHLVAAKTEPVIGTVEPEERTIARRAVKIDLAALPAKQRVATKADIDAVVRVK